jgi:hypothetical protein
MQKYLTVEKGALSGRLKLLGYYAQRICVSRRIRRLGTRSVVFGLRSRYGHAKCMDAPTPASVQDLRVRGCAHLGQLLTDQQCSEMLAYLRQRTMIAARGNGARFDMQTVPEAAAIGDYPLETVVNCPHVMQLANHPELLAMAGHYLGYTPTISLMSMRWSFPTQRADADVQHFHRDAEVDSIKLMVYLTDVDEESGPHSYVEGSHRDRMSLRLRRYSDCEVHLRHGGSNTITGPAGTGLVIDSKGIHKGTPPSRRPRLLLAIQYSLLPCLMYQYAPVPYRGPGRFDAYINRCMVAGSPSPAAIHAEEENITVAAADRTTF